MKIAFRISTMGFGGAERVFLSVAEKLAQDHGCQIHFVVDQAGKGETENLVTAAGFSLFSLGCNRTAASIWALRDYINAQQPAILISAYTDTNMACLISARLASQPCKVMVSEHASLKEHWQHAPLKRRLLLNAYVRFGYRLADHILAVSKGIQSQILAMGHPANKVSYIHNPVRFSVEQSTAEIDTAVADSSPVPVILAVGRVTKQKDYPTLIQAFYLLNKTVNAHLKIVGGVLDQHEKAKLDQLILQHQLIAKVEFVGFTENVKAYYEAADVFVLSSAWEGFGNVIVEALAFGLPVVSTNCNHGPAEILADGQFGRLVPVGDAAALADALAETIKQRHQVDKASLKKRAMDFSETTIAQQYWHLINQVTRE